jgi:PleD family two-component response regulator
MASDKIEEMDRQVEAEFVEEVRDIVSGLEVLIGNLRSGTVSAKEALPRIQRDMLNIAVRGSTVDQPLVTIVAHRFGEYVADLTSATAQQLDDMMTFLEQLRHALEGKIEASAGASVVRALPARIVGNFNPADVKITDIEVLMVISDRATAHIVGREMQACGYRTSTVRSPFQAIEMAVRTRPDLIIVSGVLDDLSGVDLATAFASMPSTRDLKVAVLTSYGLGHPSLHDLPARVPVIRKGANFGDDLAEALARLQIT